MEEVQVVHLSQEECQRLLEDRWLREVEAVEDPGGIRRWRASAKSRMASTRRATSALAVLGWRLGALAARVRGAGGRPPVADQGGGAARVDAMPEGAGPTENAACAVTPSMSTRNGHGSQAPDAWTHVDLQLLEDREDPFLEDGAPHVTQPHQPILGTPDVPPEAA
jgi:hypothetical protein